MTQYSEYFGRDGLIHYTGYLTVMDSIFLSIGVACVVYFGVFYYLLVQSYGMFALAGFFASFFFLGLGGIEFLQGLMPKED